MKWSSSQTYKDMTFGACEVNTSIKDANIGDLTHANKKNQKVKVRRNFNTLSKSWEHKRMYVNLLQ